MKYMLVFTLPSGAKLAASEFKGKFALTPIQEDGSIKNVMAWETVEELHKFWKDFTSKMDNTTKYNFRNLKPAIHEVCPEH